MKKTLLVLAAGAAMFASCSKNEVVSPEDIQGGIANPDVISFQSVVGSRANDFGLDALKGEFGFNVVALKTDGSALFAKPFTNAADEGDDALSYRYTAATTSWNWATGITDESKKWPTTAVYPLTFFAAYPSFVDGAHVLKNDGTPTQLVAAEGDMSLQVDRLAALSVVNAKPTSGVSPLTFKHIMSNVLFKVATEVGNKVYIQSIKLVNTSGLARTYNYRTGLWSAEETASSFVSSLYTPVTLTNGTAQTVTGPSDKTSVAVTTTGGNTLKLIPQGGAAGMLPSWVPATFKTGAVAWTNWTGYTSEADKILGWYNKDYSSAGGGAESGMNEGTTDAPTLAFWAGARIEVVYRMEDKDGNSLIGRKKGEKVTPEGGAEIEYLDAMFVRVGFPIDLMDELHKVEILGADGAGTGTYKHGWLPGYKYTYTINLGTPSASNGVLLAPDYKNEAGGNTDKPVDNPKTNPGDDITPEGYIQFNVGVDEWTENAGVDVN